MAYVPIAFILAGMTAYTVLAGADFGAGLWTLLSLGRSGTALRDHCRHAMGPVWEANHVWLVFVLVVCWTGYPVAFGSITSTLSAPLLIAAIGIIFRGAAYALRGVSGDDNGGRAGGGGGAHRAGGGGGASGTSRFAENLLGVGSLIAPFALGTAVGAIALGRVPVGNAAGNLVTSWLNPGSILVGILAVTFSGYLAAVYLAADAVRFSHEFPAGSAGSSSGGPTMESAFRIRAVYAGLASGALALAGLLTMRAEGLDLLRGWATVFVIISGVAGLGTLLLCWARRFALARLTASLAVAAVVVGWTVAQAPRLLPGLSVTEAATGRSTLVALIIAVCCGALVLVPSLVLLFTLFLRGRLDTPDRPVPPPAPASAGATVASAGTAPGSVTPGPVSSPPVPGDSPVAGGSPVSGSSPVSGGSPASGDSAVSGDSGAAGRGRVRGLGAAAIAGLVAGGGLLVFTDATWEHALGVVLLVLCAVSTFALATPAPGQE